MARYAGILAVWHMDNPKDELWFGFAGDTPDDLDTAQKQIQNISDRRNANEKMEHESSKWIRIVINPPAEEVEKMMQECRDHNPGRNPNDLYPGEPSKILHFPVFQQANIGV